MPLNIFKKKTAFFTCSEIGYVNQPQRSLAATPAEVYHPPVSYTVPYVLQDVASEANV